MNLKNKKVIISGGAGFIGRALIPRLLKLGCEITVISRDENKHNILRQNFPDVKCAICDIRDLDMLRSYTKGHDVGIWAASLKHIDTCSNNWQIAKEIIVDGAINSRKVSEEYLEAAVFISTDKAKSPTTYYGQLKAVAGELFILGASDCRLATVIYGNVWNSTGSIVPLIWNRLHSDSEMTLYSKEMTRFMIDAGHAVDLVLDSLDHTRCYTLPKLSSFSVCDLFEIYQQKYGLNYIIGTPRLTEKTHEVMAVEEEVQRMRWVENEHQGMYVLDLQAISNSVSFNAGSYSSKDYIVSKLELEGILERNNYFEPTNQMNNNFLK
jgi:UDP-N-acetylglucosamine 4,6-dehydratase